MNIEYIIVQAGGKGTRLEHLTVNKPKAIVPVNNLPMIFHLFRKFPDKKFVIIGDYKKEVFRKYLNCFADVRYIFTEAEGSGTCSGVKNALRFIPDDTPFMLIWSDLILPEEYELPSENGNYVGISQTFNCRWSYINGGFQETPSTENGVAGMFIFENKALISDVEQSGEFVRWLNDKKIPFMETGLAGTREFGLISEYNKLSVEKCRPFNRMTEENGILTKEGIDEQGKKLASRERSWYAFVRKLGFSALPEIYSLEPIRMEKIHGKNIYEYGGFSYEKKKAILEKIVGSLSELHGLRGCPADSFSVWEAYVTKTFDRLEKIRGLVPLSDEKYITVNKRSCRNVFMNRDEVERRLLKYKCPEFRLIHGDCTFSNIMLRNDEEPVLIDPRGYFGSTELFGDAAYDWAKLYYSIKGNYDRFNLKEFRLDIGDEIKLDIASNSWEDMERDFLAMIDIPAEDIQLLHAIIWLSLTTYAWQDYDSICGAFYNGIYYLEEIL